VRKLLSDRVVDLLLRIYLEGKKIADSKPEFNEVVLIHSVATYWASKVGRVIFMGGVSNLAS
jgi:hypothetical protein